MDHFCSNKAVITFLILALINFSFIGCFASQEVIVSEEPDVKIERVLLNDSTEIDFTRRQPGYAVISGDSVVFIQKDLVVDSYPLSKIEKIYTSEFSLGRTILLTVGIAGVVFIGLIAFVIISMDGRGVGG